MIYIILFTTVFLFLIGCKQDKPVVSNHQCKCVDKVIYIDLPKELWGKVIFTNSPGYRYTFDFTEKKQPRHYKVTGRLESPKASGESHDHFSGEYNK